jgi:lambda family phage holin
MKDLPPEVLGVLLAVFMAFLRLVYDGKETRPIRILLEMAICGGLGLAASSGISAMGWSPDWAIAAGCAIGYLGPLTIRAMALRAISARIGK